ncbi:Cytochrome P450 2L1 [Portunus trituberculatus]|uniref:Cytochrome P450 2L1 n=1 Tax=Portunus trituberculatus TaxID=210409 RepID=A0A5B7IAQ4_PORTR|nr:Cytochrome P450 2L1 [Portunus trituberculatus]
MTMPDINKQRHITCFLTSVSQRLLFKIQFWVDLRIHRRFVLRHLRNLGMGKSKVELDIQEEAVHLVEDFKKHTDKDETVPMSLGVAVFNVLASEWTTNELMI